jgi:hypothetical protein
LIALLSLILASAPAIADARSPDVSTFNCKAVNPKFIDYFRESPGSYSPASIHCGVGFGPSIDPWLALSPDGNTLAWIMREPGAAADGSRDELKFSTLWTKKTLTVSKSSKTFTDQAPAWISALIWSADSASVWAASQVTNLPNGFSLAGISLVRVKPDGSIQALPLPRSTAGPIDAVTWLDRSGRALVQFGTAGEYYRPSHADTDPTIAMVDARTGKVLDKLPLYSLPTYKQRRPVTSPRSAIAAMTGITVNGQSKAMIEIAALGGNRWVFWTQGKPPREVAAPVGSHRFTKVAFLPSGRQFLVARRLQPTGLRIFCGSGPCGGPQPPITPATGSVLELRDFETGAIVWAIPRTVSQFWQGQLLEVSDDGRYALTSWPDEQDRSEHIALIRLQDGAVEQFFPLGSSYGRAGFLNGSRTIWTVNGSVTFYKIRD